MNAPENHILNANLAMIGDYIKANWKLVPIQPGTKGPSGAAAVGWNLPENALKSVADLPDGWGVGLLHSLSNTMAFDIDDGVATRQWFAERNIDIRPWFAAPDSVQVISGNPNHAKLLFKLPPFIGALPTKKVLVNKKTAFELRCATADGKSMQDILPPSVHPSGSVYQWAGNGSWQNLPDAPAALLGIWAMLLEVKHESASGDPTDINWDEVKSALKEIPASVCHDDWLEIIMALHSTGHAEAYETARSWSMTCAEKYPGDNTFNARWRSFSEKPNGITIASLFHHAKEHGWIAPPPDVTKLFNAPPQNILDGMFMPPPVANLSLFPASLRDPAIEVSETIGCDPLIPIFAGLGAVMAAADARSRLELWPGYLVPPVLWLAGIGSPADKKSPGSKPMYAVLAEIERDDIARYKMDLLAWEVEEAAYAAAKKDLLAKGSDAEHALTNQGENNILTGLPQLPQLRPQPVPKRLVISDATTQKAVRIAADRPEGLLLNLDETHGFLKKLTNPTGGEDRSSLVAGYNVEPYFMDRVGAGSIVAENLAIAVYACFQPDVLKQYAPLLKSDGFVQRFVFAVFNRNFRRASKPIPKWSSIMPQWEHLVRQIHAAGERHYTLSPEAYKLMRDFEVEGIDLTNRYETAQYSSMLVTAFGKLLGTTGRLMHVFHLIEDRDNPVVSEQTARNAIAFIRSYVVPCWHHVVQSILGDESLDRHVCELIAHRSNEATITLSDIKRGLRWQLEGIHTGVAGEMIRGVMGELEARQWVALVEDSRKSTVWAIHPEVMVKFADFRKKIVDSKAAIHQSILEAAAIRRNEKNV